MGELVMTYCIAGERFASLSSVKSRVKQILSRGRRSKSVLSGQDLRFMMEIFMNHPDAREKSGSGVVGIEVHEGPDGVEHSELKKWDALTFCFYVRRRDGSLMDFSTKYCVNKKLRRCR